MLSIVTTVDGLLRDFNGETFSQDLLYWFERNMRTLPWREDRDPYKIWISEIMLQQTRVDTVIDYYRNFINKFPTVHDLAAAEEDEVLKQWEGLGYYSRARNLHQAAREVRDQYGGRVPDDPREISKLKGVGPYTAGAILSIAYGKREPAVDGNVMRVFSRLFDIREDIQKPGTKKMFEELVRRLIPDQEASYFNQGVMELGALICTPKSPQCLTCPVRTHCRAQKLGMQEQLPVKPKKKKQRLEHMVAALVVCDGCVLIRQRPDTGLLAKLFEFPNVQWSPDREKAPEAIAKHLYTTYGIRSEAEAELDKVKHTFTHLIWDISVYDMCIVAGVNRADGSSAAPVSVFESSPEGGMSAVQKSEPLWVDIHDLDTFTFSVSHQKIKSQLEKRYRLLSMHKLPVKSSH